MELLTLRSISKHFHRLVAVNDIDLTVRAGEVHGLVGPNGAGKTTLFNVITGFLAPSRGEVSFAGEDITRAAVHTRVRLGLARTFQTPQLFPEMTVRENVLVGLFAHSRLGLARASEHGSGRPEADRAQQILQFVGLTAMTEARASELPYGPQRKLEIARALMTKPRLLLLDEPAAGMNPVEVDELNDLIRRIRAQGCTVLVVEHNMRVIMQISDVVSVMDFGRLIAEGRPEDVRNNPDVIRAYLGSTHDAAA